jgi:hypothetical protein
MSIPHKIVCFHSRNKLVISSDLHRHNPNSGEDIRSEMGVREKESFQLDITIAIITHSTLRREMGDGGGKYFRMFMLCNKSEREGESECEEATTIS